MRGDYFVGAKKKKYKIGEIADLAGVSRRTIDYYTNLGLLVPIRFPNNYRYYTEDTLVRLKIIESLKASRLTLVEIREQFGLLEQVTASESGAVSGSKKGVSIDLLRNQIKQLEQQLGQLPPLAAGLDVAGMDINEAMDLRKKIMFQSMALVQSLMIYMNQIYSGL